MKTLPKILLIFFLLLFSVNVFGQSSNDASALVKQGVALNDEGKYKEAIDKYKEALKLDPNFLLADYELSYTLFASGRGKEAFPYLEKATSENSPYRAQAYDLLGSIYDDDNQPDKAIEYYKEGIKADTQYQRLHFNLGISYLRKKMYAEAELCAIDAIKLDPKHASSQRVYAIATYYQKKRASSLLAWCSFLLLEPQTKRSGEAYLYVQNILNYGIKKTGEKSITISISPSESGSNELIMPIAVLGATSDKKNLTAIDSLQLQLTSVFKILGETEQNKTQTFYSTFFAKYFENLANSAHMPAFARLVSLSAYKERNLKWFKENDTQLTALNNWVEAMERKF